MRWWSISAGGTALDTTALSGVYWSDKREDGDHTLRYLASKDCGEGKIPDFIPLASRYFDRPASAVKN